jgi:hypothetical protein
MKYAVINVDSVVENIIEAPDGFTMKGKTLVDATGANIGDLYQDGKFAKPEQA